MLDQQDIQILRQMMENTMRTAIEPVNQRLDSMETRMGSMETRMGSMETRMDSMETRMDSMETRMDSMESEIRGLKTLYEVDAAHRFDLLAEGQQAIQERLDRMDPERRFQEFDDDGVVLRAAVKQLARDVRDLKYKVR